MFYHLSMVYTKNLFYIVTVNDRNIVIRINQKTIKSHKTTSSIPCFEYQNLT